MNEPANDNGKKPRKQRAKGLRAPNKKAEPREWASHQLGRAYTIVQRVLYTTHNWGAGNSSQLTDATINITAARMLFKEMAPDFKAPRKRRAKKDLTVSEDSSNI